MTRERAIAHQARALLDVAEHAGHADLVADELDAASAAIAADPANASVLLNPVVPPQVKVESVEAIAAAGLLTTTSARLLVILAERDALASLPALATVYRARLLDRRNIVAAEITTAVPLPPDRTAALAARLGEVTGKQVQLAAKVDASIIGGVVARVGSTVYDGSVMTQLARMRQKLVENV